MNIVTDNIINPDKDSILYRKCQPVTKDDDRESMAEILSSATHSYNAYGVAANQLGIDKQAFCVRDDGVCHIFFNPEIVAMSDSKKLFLEGCLSFPDLFVKIKRPTEIELKFEDNNGETHVEKYDGIMARIIQHEIDHLNGKRFFDNATRYHLDQGINNLKKTKKRR